MTLNYIELHTIRMTGIAALALLFLVSAGQAGSASNSTAAGDLILAPEKIYLDPWYPGDSPGCPGNVTLLKEGYMLSIDSLNFTSIPAKDGVWGKTIWIGIFRDFLVFAVTLSSISSIALGLFSPMIAVESSIQIGDIIYE